MFEDPKFWLLISFIIFLILMYKPFKSMMIGGLDTKIEEIKKSINSSLQSFNDSEKKLDEAQKQTSDLENKINELLSSAKLQAESSSKDIIEKTIKLLHLRKKILWIESNKLNSQLFNLLKTKLQRSSISS